MWTPGVPIKRPQHLNCFDQLCLFMKCKVIGDLIEALAVQYNLYFPSAQLSKGHCCLFRWNRAGWVNEHRDCSTLDGLAWLGAELKVMYQQDIWHYIMNLIYKLLFVGWIKYGFNMFPKSITINDMNIVLNCLCQTLWDIFVWLFPCLNNTFLSVFL